MCVQSSAASSCGPQTDARQNSEALDSEDEDRLQNRIQQYERKIETLLEQVAQLEREVCIASE